MADPRIAKGEPVGDDDQREWLRRRVTKVMEPLIQGTASQAVAARVEGLLDIAARYHQAQDEAYRSLLRELLARLAGSHDPEEAAVYELLAASLDAPLKPEEIRQIQSLVPGAAPLCRQGSDELCPNAPADDPPPGEDDRIDGAEHRANALFKHHLDDRTREFEALRERLCEDAHRTIQMNREAGRLLDSLITRLQLGTTLPEVLDARLEMAEEVQRIAEAHDTVANKLEETFESLQSLTVDNARLQEELQRVRVLSLTDENTDLPNRRAFLRQLQAEMARVGREGGSFSVAILDLDRFKEINDRSGHGAGDRVLLTYASHVLSSFRAQDLVARYGGEEFAILLPSTQAQDASRAVAKIREVARGMQIEWEGEPIALPTFSAGIAEYRADRTPEELINRADRALYRAKANGRDRIELDADKPTAAAASGLLRDPLVRERERGVSS
jgi:diguanylate cyclase (GGDEF)-like protein